MPSAHGYIFQTDYLFPFPDDPSSSIAESNGNLYGTTPNGGSRGNAYGTVFEMSEKSGAWTATILCSFTAENDGNSPEGSVLVDQHRNVYGTASFGGQYSDGVIYEITP